MNIVPNAISNLYYPPQRLYHYYGTNYSNAKVDAALMIGTATRVVLAAAIIFTAVRFSLFAAAALGACSLPATIMAVGALAARESVTRLFHSVSLDHVQTACTYAVTAWALFQFTFATKNMTQLNFAEKYIDQLTDSLATWVAKFYNPAASQQ